MAVVRYMVFPPSTPESTRDHIAQCIRIANAHPRRVYDVGIVRTSTDELIGGITLDVHDPDAGVAAFSYLLNRAICAAERAVRYCAIIVRRNVAPNIRNCQDRSAEQDWHARQCR